MSKKYLSSGPLLALATTLTSIACTVQAPLIESSPNATTSRGNQVPSLIPIQSLTPVEVVPPQNNIDSLLRRSLSFETRFLKRVFFKFSNKQSLVFRSADELDLFVRGSNVASDLIRPLLNLDFSKQTGILMIFGAQPTLRRCEIVSLEHQDNLITVHSVRWNGESSTDGLAQVGIPAHYIAIPATSETIKFADLIEAKENERPQSHSWPTITY